MKKVKVNYNLLKNFFCGCNKYFRKRVKRITKSLNLKLVSNLKYSAFRNFFTQKFPLLLFNFPRWRRHKEIFSLFPSYKFFLFPRVFFSPPIHLSLIKSGKVFFRLKLAGHFYILAMRKRRRRTLLQIHPLSVSLAHTCFPCQHKIVSSLFCLPFYSKRTSHVKVSEHDFFVK